MLGLVIYRSTVGVVMGSLWNLMIAATCCAASSFSQSALIDAGNGLVVDTTLSVSWMKDGNLAKTLCDSSDPVFTSWAGTVDDTPATICSNDGAMTWADAEAWIAHLNSQNYLGFNDWRQSSAAQPDASCESPSAYGYNCTNSEFGNLFNLSLNNPNEAGTGATGGTVGSACYVAAPSQAGPAQCLQNIGVFENVWLPFYWTAETLTGVSANALVFSMARGEQQNGTKTVNQNFVWPLRSGIVAITQSQAVPTAPLWAYFFIVGIGFVSLRRKFKNLRFG